MEGRHLNRISIFLFLWFAMATTLVLGQGTRVGFYATSCPRVESIVQSTVRSYFQTDRTIAGPLLRMHFHDCFVQGCDGSVLIEGPNTERTAGPNARLRGFEVIDDAKAQLERACPGVVSCADILALVARDAVVLAGGLSWAVPTGRRDGRVSVAADTANLPNFRDPIAIQRQKFQQKGLNVQDLVALVGGHTIGTTACSLFSYRLSNFNSTHPVDPSINPSFLPTLRSLCPAGGDGNRRVALDTGSETRFDTSFFSNLQNGRGVLESDQMLWTDATTRTIVQRFLAIRGLQGSAFGTEFGRSMVKMSNVEVKTGTVGEIRRVCNAIN